MLGLWAGVDWLSTKHILICFIHSHLRLSHCATSLLWSRNVCRCERRWKGWRVRVRERRRPNTARVKHPLFDGRTDWLSRKWNLECSGSRPSESDGSCVKSVEECYLSQELLPPYQAGCVLYPYFVFVSVPIFERIRPRNAQCRYPHLFRGVVHSSLCTTGAVI